MNNQRFVISALLLSLMMTSGPRVTRASAAQPVLSQVEGVSTPAERSTATASLLEGAGWNYDVRVDDATGGSDQLFADLTIGGDGTLYAIWEDYRNGTYRKAGDIYFASSTDSGQTWSANIRVNDDAQAGAQRRKPHIAVAPDGDVYVVWVDWRNDPNPTDPDITPEDSQNPDIYLAKLPLGATSFLTNVLVYNQGDYQDSPDVEVDGNGYVYVAWYDRTGDIYYGNSVVAQSTDGGAAFGSPVTVDNSSSWSLEPRLAINRSNNHVFIAWQDHRDSYYKPYFARSTDGGANWSTDVRLDAGPNREWYDAAREIVVAADGSDHVLAIWADERNDPDNCYTGSTCHDEFDIYTTYSTDGGATWPGDNVMLNDNSDYAWIRAPSVAFAPNGTVAAVWRDSRAGDAIPDIWMAISTDHGASWSTNGRLDHAPAGAAAYRPVVAVDGDGYGYVIWDDNRNGDLDIYVTKIPIAVSSVGGSLILFANDLIFSGQEILASARVNNPTGETHTYTVTVSLRQDGAILATQSPTMTVMPGGSQTVGVNFGTRPVGRYQLVAELRLGTTLLQTTESLDLLIPSSFAHVRAEEAGEELTAQAQAELDEIGNTVAQRYADSLVGLGADVLSFVAGEVIGEHFKIVGEAYAGFTAGQVQGAWMEVVPVVDSIVGIAAGKTHGAIEQEAGQEVEKSALAEQRNSVTSRLSQFKHDVSEETDPTWSFGMDQLVSRYQDDISNVTEEKRIWGFQKISLWDPIPLGRTTLEREDQAFDYYQAKKAWLGRLIFLASLVILVLAGLAAIGTAPESLGASVASYVAALPGLIATLVKSKLIAAAAIVLLVLVMHMQAKVWVAPAVTETHDQHLDTITGQIQGSTGVVFENLTTQPSVEGGQVTLSTHLTNADIAPARPLVETYLYSVDGRVIDIFRHQPAIGALESAAWDETITLSPGYYKVITAIHTHDQIGLDSQMIVLEIASPTVALGVSLDESQLALGQAVHATIVLTNTNAVSETGDLAVVAGSSDGENINGWLVNLGPGASQTWEYGFASQEAGGYTLRVSVTDGDHILATYDVPYVVGDGAALAVNVAAETVYSPGVTVTFPITATNAGNLPTSTILSLVIVDRGDQTSVHTETLPLNVNASASVSAIATALPAAMAQPGRYAADFFLGDGDEVYTSRDFTVAAEDTLYATISPDSIFNAVGDDVVLNVEVMNSVFTYTEADVTVLVWQPDGVTQTVSVVPTSTGQYQGSVTATITGTYAVEVDVSKANCRGVSDHTFFIAGQGSQLRPVIDGHPLLNMTAPVTVTVSNEHGTPILKAHLVVSGTNGYLSGQTDEAGQVVLYLSPVVTDAYQVNLEKSGFGQTTMDLPVWIAPDVTPPYLVLNAPSITNHTPVTVTGVTEPGATLSINSAGVAVDAQGGFTTTLPLSEGGNPITATATDVVSNTTTVTWTVILDTVSPTLTVTYPPEGLATTQEVISVTGTTEAGGSFLMVNNTWVAVDPANGDFSAWALLNPGSNTISVVAMDAAENSMTITRMVKLSYPIYLPLVMRNF
jgi:hypothetical protein